MELFLSRGHLFDPLTLLLTKWFLTLLLCLNLYALSKVLKYYQLVKVVQTE